MCLEHDEARGTANPKPKTLNSLNPQHLSTKLKTNRNPQRPRLTAPVCEELPARSKSEDLNPATLPNQKPLTPDLL